MDYIQKPPVHHLSVWGHRGRAHLDFHAGTLSWIMSDKPAEQIIADRQFSRNDMFISEMRHFLEAVAVLRATDIPIEEGIAGLRIVAQARRDAELRDARNR